MTLGNFRKLEWIEGFNESTYQIIVEFSFNKIDNWFTTHANISLTQDMDAGNFDGDQLKKIIYAYFKIMPIKTSRWAIQFDANAMKDYDYITQDLIDNAQMDYIDIENKIVKIRIDDDAVEL